MRLDMPVLFIDGEDDVIIDVRGSVKRLSSLIPSAEVQLLTDCGHVVANSIDYIIPFLMKRQADVGDL